MKHIDPPDAALLRRHGGKGYLAIFCHHSMNNNGFAEEETCQVEVRCSVLIRPTAKHLKARQSTQLHSFRIWQTRNFVGLPEPRAKVQLL